MDKHILAGFSVTGTSLDLLGGLYLAYELLGGKHGPLRALTRMVTYSLFFGVCFGVPLGLAPGLNVGLGLGFTLSNEFDRAARGKDHAAGSDGKAACDSKTNARRGVVSGFVWPSLPYWFVLLNIPVN